MGCVLCRFFTDKKVETKQFGSLFFCSDQIKLFSLNVRRLFLRYINVRADRYSYLLCVMDSKRKLLRNIGLFNTACLMLSSCVYHRNCAHTKRNNLYYSSMSTNDWFSKVMIALVKVTFIVSLISALKYMSPKTINNSLSEKHYCEVTR